ncbi:hypothetical protein K1T71_008732 [Dendrolimus kikuchii]|uniref:Uncharacterized protein n=1 Tax=Dendrolimus kikuchii TaxID=765133 RepID=A0ACC1CW89_9NEOP|nr:hypothetical protein K1T71_008732 [Dendrolimus kikuchii]
MNVQPAHIKSDNIEENESVEDPINDIIDYLVRCAKISFKNAQLDKKELRTSDRIRMACDMYNRSPTEFLIQFGKYLAPYHLKYFENSAENGSVEFRECVQRLNQYHSDVSRHKRIRNRRYNALQKFKTETDYFSEKQMMYRNPLLYEQLVGQYLTDEEIWERDRVDIDGVSFLNIVLETVDRNQMRETKNEQMLHEELESDISSAHIQDNVYKPETYKQWGEFEIPDTTPKYKPETRLQSMIPAPERRLLREEFVREMYNSFIEGRDTDIDYHTIDFDENYDDLKQLSQDAEDKYFDSEANDGQTLEEHMTLTEEYGRQSTNGNIDEDPLDKFMNHISNKV